MNIYQSKIQEYKIALEKSDKVIDKLSTLRLVAFVCSLVLIMFLANAGMVILVLIVVPVCLVLFGLLINRYNRLSYQRKHTAFLKGINEQEVLRQENKLSDFQTGQSFINRDHDYVSDFDIFGTHSLFQLLNRTTTESGHVLLAKWLSEPAPVPVILQRQESVKELSPKLDWRQDLQASGMHFNNTKRGYDKLLGWIEEPVQILPRRIQYLIISLVLALVSTVAAAYFMYGLVNFIDAFSFKFIIPLIVMLLVNTRFLKRFRQQAEEIIDNSVPNIKILGGYQSLITKIESEKFNSEILKQLQSVFSQDGYSAVGEINQLKRILEIFQQRGTKTAIGQNTFYSIFNKLWLLDVHLIIQTEKWKAKNSSYLKVWASAVSEFEVLSSLAGFAYSNPSYCFPEITEKPYLIEFKKLGHPLIIQERRVSNDFELNGQGEIVLITGSNMAGKSTFLRTIGVNLVLALMGAPCCAASGRVSPIKIFTSMRTQDNLEEGISSFYAELRRIEQLLKLIESGEAIFFLLDEMFKGTNSHDRYKGGASLIRQLSELNAFGIISTHDLELAKLTASDPHVANFSFNSEIKEGEIIFNYALTKGICNDFNASALMKKSGIRILADIEEA
jgi:DNA mismatch repair ATPase MutS